MISLTTTEDPDFSGRMTQTRSIITFFFPQFFSLQKIIYRDVLKNPYFTESQNCSFHLSFFYIILQINEEFMSFNIPRIITRLFQATIES